MELKHFECHEDVMTYVFSELIATLEDDLHRMSGAEWNDYTDEARQELANCIADIKLVREREGL